MQTWEYKVLLLYFIWVHVTLTYGFTLILNPPNISTRLNRVMPSPKSLAKSVIKNWSWLCWRNVLAHVVNICEKSHCHSECTGSLLSESSLMRKLLSAASYKFLIRNDWDESASLLYESKVQRIQVERLTVVVFVVTVDWLRCEAKLQLLLGGRMTTFCLGKSMLSLV